MIRTRVGYAGGEKANPTYIKMGDHTETLQIDYNPEQISYAELLEAFWDSHNPRVNSRSSQYKNILFYHDEEQKKLAEQTKASLEEQIGSTVQTEIRPFTNFYLAEDYHQKYYLQNNNKLMNKLEGEFDCFQAFVDSTAAARLNGYAAGYGDKEELEKELEKALEETF